MKADGIKPALPENPAPYLTDWLFEIGPGLPTGNGMVEMGWQMIAEWQSVMGVALLPWEAKILRRLSRDFVAQWHESRDPDCPPPYQDRKRMAQNRDAVSRKVGGILGGRSPQRRPGMVKSREKL